MKKSNLLPFLLCLFSTAVNAELVSCKLTYNINGWSFIYKEYRGIGVVNCNDGQHANVSILSRGAGVTVGKSEIRNGTGVFTGIYNIHEVYGTYFSMGGHAGATLSVEAQVMTKGEVSLALSGKGRGIDLGLVFSGVTIAPL